VKRLFAYAVLWLVIPILMIIAFTYRQVGDVTSFGLLETYNETSSPLRRPVILAGACLLGILSKALYDEFLRPRAKQAGFYATVARGLAPERVVISLIVSPIIILSAYTRIDQVDDLVLVALIAYQTGFFFQTVLNGHRKS
jgi:hypothetical protein